MTESRSKQVADALDELEKSLDRSVSLVKAMKRVEGERAEKASNAARKAWDTRRDNETEDDSPSGEPDGLEQETSSAPSA